MPDTGCIVSGINKDLRGEAGPCPGGSSTISASIPALAPAFGIPEGAHCLGKCCLPGQSEVLKGRV
ncbi:hypothetical protein LAB1_06420 [Roseibium sp. LAB1]